MRSPPPEVIATWPKPNYVNPETRGSSLIIVECIGLSAALICLALRLYVRAFLMRNTGWDDWIMCVAMVFSIALTVAACLASSLYGWDRHVWDLTPIQMVQGRQISLAIQAIFVLASVFAKISIIVSYLRLALINSWFRKACIGSIYFVIISNTPLFIVLFSQCRPISDYWNIFKPKTNCLPESPPLLAQSIMTVLTDFLVWALPLHTLYAARLPLSQRIALIILFSFGLFVCVAGCVRTYWIHYIIDKTFDPTWQGFHLWIWTAIEIHLGVICGCVPWLKSLINYKKGSSEPTELSHGYVKSGGTATIGGSGAPRGPSKAGSSGLKSPRSRILDGIDSKWLGDTSSVEGEEIDMDSYGTKSQRTSSTHPIVPSMTNNDK